MGRQRVERSKQPRAVLKGGATGHPQVLVPRHDRDAYAGDAADAACLVLSVAVVSNALAAAISGLGSGAVSANAKRSAATLTGSG